MNPLPHQDCTASGEENESGDASQKDYGEPSDFSSHNENSNQQHWVILKLLSVIQYIIFGAFVLTCNKIRRYLKHQRQRNNSNGSSDSLEVRINWWVEGADIGWRGQRGWRGLA